MQKKFSIYIICLCVLTNIFLSYVLADDYDEYIEEIEDILSTEIEASSDITDEPTINARHSVVLERDTNIVLYGKKENERCKMASTTKIITAIVVIENCQNLQNTVIVSKKAASTGGSRLGLSTNCKITIKDLLYGLMMVSGNDAAIALSEAIGGTTEEFINMMNKKAEELELKNTHFETPHGLDKDEHYTTAYELAVITNYALKNETFSKIVRTSNYTITIDGKAKSLRNTNELLGYLDGVYGVKTGFTNGANRCLVTACKRGNLDVICVVLGCDAKKNRTMDSINLINYVFNNFSKINIKDIVDKNFEKWKQENEYTFWVDKGIDTKLDLYLNDKNISYDTVIMKNSDLDTITTSILADFEFEAPLPQETKIGIMKVNFEGKELFNIEILNRNSIQKKQVLHYVKDFLENYCSYF